MTTFNSDGTTDTSKAHSLPDVEPNPDIQLDVPPDVDDDGINDAGPDGDNAETVAAIADLATDPAERPEPEPGRTFDAEVIAAELPTPEPEPTTTAVALAPRFDLTKTDEVWEHDFLEFKGDKLGIRVPTRQALAAFSLASGKYVDIGVKNDLTGLFIARHLSPESYGRVFSRLMDPDEDDYDVDTVGELFNAIVTASLQTPKDGDGKAS